MPHPYENQILLVLDEVGGFDTSHIANKVGGSSNRRKNSQLIRQLLLKLEEAGLVSKMDDEKPVCWLRTFAGSQVVRNIQ